MIIIHFQSYAIEIHGQFKSVKMHLYNITQTTQTHYTILKNHPNLYQNLKTIHSNVGTIKITQNHHCNFYKLA